MTGPDRSGSRGTRRCRAGITLVLVLAVAGCTAPSPRRSAAPAPSATTATAAPTAATTPSSACSAPTADTPAPTDFPHPVLTPRAAPTAVSSADDALAAQGLAATSAFGGPIAAAAFQHYLDATGDYLALPVDGLLSTNPALVAELDGVLIDAAADVVQRAVEAAGPPCAPVEFTSGWQPHDDVADDDWHYTLGRFYFQVLGTVTRDADSAGSPAGTGAVRVTFRAALGDTYNFDPGTAFAQFGQLALDGRAADYLDGGLTTPRTATVLKSSAELAAPGFG